ncbi:MAG: endolytic transglycosylase MltG [Deltaproteobacteria bacterium]|nr:endolytic transglycosylase MltG [Deltaproteobacteria bacterium]
MPVQLSHKKKVIIVLCLFILAGVLVLTGLGYYLLSPATTGTPDQTFFVLEGSTLSAVAGDLETKEIITRKSVFLVCARVMGYGRNIKAGEYRLNSGMSPLEILDILRRGAIVTHTVTIPEGFTREQIGRLLEQKSLVDKDEFMTLTGDPDVAASYGVSGPDLEGFLYPDTYQLSRGLTAKSVIDVLVNQFWEVAAPFRGRLEELDMTLEQVVILASIVEKETGRAEERPIIASVFLNRLKKRKRLESDPTVIYGINNFDGNLRKKDLTSHTRYNTYVIRGLPPGAIANPGKEAIRAVLYPARTEYLYFVSKNDGSHHFSKTLSEHNRAVRIYQKKKR